MNTYGKNRTPFLFIINFNLTQAIVLTESEAFKNKVFFHLNGNGNQLPHKPVVSEQVTFEKNPVSFEQYRQAFDKVSAHISLGNTYLLNLTFPTPVKTNLGLREIYNQSHSGYRLLYKDKFVVFSPETFVKIENNTISSFPMKGTIDAGVPDATAKLMSDPKEKAEHNTIVDLIRNDLSMVSDHVRVVRFRYPEMISTLDKELLQTSSEISGDLDPRWNEYIGDILLALLPAGSVTGAPKRKTVEILKEAENYDRGFYTGIFGYFNGDSLDSAVMIRFIEKTRDGLVYKSGGGITCFSDCRSEYKELIDKVYLPFN